MLKKAVVTNLISKQFGKFASKRFPSCAQKTINKTYVKLMGVSLEEFKEVEHYRSLNELFTRQLVKNRVFSKDENTFISPCDSMITEAGDLEKDKLMQIKGFEYSVDDLLTDFIDQDKKEKVYDGKYINFYLSPKDYHRFHVPLDMRVSKVIQVSGLLYPVNLKYLNKVQNLFIKNERVILKCYDKNDNLFFMVFVGALNVGKVVINFDDRIDTNAAVKNTREYVYGDIHLKKGDELGCFKMGSTVVMIFEKDYVDLEVDVNKKVRFGESVAKIKS